MDTSEGKKSLALETVRIFLRYAKPFWKQISMVVLFVWTATSIELFRPWLYRDLLNIFGQTQRDIGQAWEVLCWLLGFSIFAALLRRSSDYFTNKYQANVKEAILKDSFRVLHAQSYSFFTQNFAGSLVKKAGKYDSAFERLADQFTWGLGQTILQVVIVCFAVMFFKFEFAVIFIVWVIIYAIYTIKAIQKKRPKDIAKTESDSKMTGWLSDSISNFSTIKSFGSIDHERRGFERQVSDFKVKLYDAWRSGSRISIGQVVMGVILQILWLGLAVYYWSKGEFTVGDLGLLQIYLGQVTGRLWDLGRQVQAVTTTLADANEMTEIILKTPEILDHPKATKLKVKKGEVVFDRVSFAYELHEQSKETDKEKTSDEARSVLKDFTLTIRHGEKLALVGPSGGGKSTITKLLFRFYDVNSGSIKVDGQDIAKVTQDSLRKAMSLVPQEPILFHRSLKENIRYGKPEASDEEVIGAAKKAHAHEFISKFDEGYDTLVGERGVKLSGGERQRIAIARAILKNAPILVLDEATSALDSESELLIQDALKKLMKDKTVIVIAHRLSTIMQMDRIVVIEHGTVKEEGKHKELLKMKDGMYQKLWGIQAGGFA